jgi:hypothetical protein
MFKKGAVNIFLLLETKQTGCSLHRQFTARLILWRSAINSRALPASSVVENPALVQIIFPKDFSLTPVKFHSTHAVLLIYHENLVTHIYLGLQHLESQCHHHCSN